MNSSILQEAITDANTDPVGIIDDLCDLQTYHTAEEYPRTYQESQSRPDAAHWHKAALEELQAHQDNNTWTLIKPKAHQKPIKTRWVFTKKRRANGEETYKARLVAKGCSQRFGIDYQETYSSVLAHTSLRILISIAVTKGWKLYQK